MKKKARENADGEKQEPAGTTDAPTCTFSNFQHFRLFRLFDFFDFQKFMTRKVLGLERSGLHQRV